MPNLPVPDLMLSDIYELRASALAAMGIKLLLLDLDNTLVPYGDDRAGAKLRSWIDSLKKAGVEPFILSNNRGYRPKLFAGQLNVGFLGSAKKPSPERLLAVLAEKGTARQNAAIIGDQIYTDVLCGKRAGIFTIAVRPISLRNPLLLLRYGLERPFRGRAGGRTQNNDKEG